MFEIRKGDTRGGFDFGWLKTLHSFSFGDYHDPARMGFRSLRVINEDWIQPGQGFGTHGHRDMEIFTWVLEGALEHQDSLGTKGVLRPGEAQVMSAGSGIRHSEYNASGTEPVHLLQIWLLPERPSLAPRYDQMAFAPEYLADRWGLLASRTGEAGTLQIFQDVRIHAARLGAGSTLDTALDPDRFAYLHVARGQVRMEGQELAAGDALLLSERPGLSLEALSEAEVLRFDLA